MLTHPVRSLVTLLELTDDLVDESEPPREGRVEDLGARDALADVAQRLVVA